MFEPLTYRTIELIHDIKTLTWQIPCKEGTYISITQELLDYADLELLQEMFFEIYDEKIPLTVFEAMRRYGLNPHSRFIVPVVDDIPPEYYAF